jgi:hypothetical protein
MDKRRPAPRLYGAAKGDPRAVAAHDHLCQAADLLEELNRETQDERLRLAMMIIDMTRQQLKDL